MKFIILGSKAYNEIIVRLDAIQKAMKTEKPEKAANVTKCNFQEEWLTASELCARLSIDRKTLYHWIKKYQLSYKRPGKGHYLFDYKSIITQLEQNSKENHN